MKMQLFLLNLLDHMLILSKIISMVLFDNLMNCDLKLKDLLKNRKKINLYKKNSFKIINYWNNDISLKSFESIFNDQ